MKISIAYLLMQMPAPSEAFLAVEINGLKRVGIDVKVFCLRGPHPQFEELRVNQELTSVPLFTYPFFFSWRLWIDVLYWLKQKPGVLGHLISLITRTCWRKPTIWIKSLILVPKSFSIARSVQTQQIQVLHAAWGHYPAITAYLIKQLMPSTQFTLALGAYDRLMKHPMTKFTAEHASYILTQSQTTADLIKNEWPQPSKPIIVIRRGIDIDSRRSLCTLNTRIPGLIVSAGRLERDKGHQYLIHAFARVHRILPQSRLIVLGEGGYRYELQRIIKNLGLTGLVEMPGYLPQATVFDCFAKANVFVLATESKSDVLPNVVKEAMALGVPVVTTPTTGIEELIQDGITGYIVPMKDVRAISNRLLWILNNAIAVKQLEQHARSHIDRNFNISKTSEERKKLYRTLARVSISPVTMVVNDEIIVGAVDSNPRSHTICNRI